MLGNRVSPATLCSGSSSNAYLKEVGEEDSQHSQASLFSSDPPSSLELFSQPPPSQFHAAPLHSSQFHFQSSQPHSSQPHLSQPHLTQPQPHLSQLHSSQSQLHSSQPHSSQSQLQMCSSQNRSFTDSSQSQSGSAGRKYYMKYLSTVPVCRGDQASKGKGKTPLNVSGKRLEVRCTKTSFESWKNNQQEKLQDKKIIDTVVQTTKDISRELSQTLENLRVEVKEAIQKPSPEHQASDCAVRDDKWGSVLASLLQGQADIRVQITDLQKQCSQRDMMELLQRQLHSVEANQLKLQQQGSPPRPSDLTKPLMEAMEMPLSRQNSKLDLLLERVSALEVASCVRETRTGDEREMERESSRKNLPLFSGLDRNDSKVPSVFTSLQRCEQTVPALDHDGTLTQTEEQEAYSIYGAGQLEHSKDVKKAALPKACDNSSSDGTDYSTVPLVVAAKAQSTVLAHGVLVTQSQSSSSTTYDIDLSQQSPSLCSQIISQHLEQFASGSTTVEGRAKKINPSQNGSTSSLQCGRPCVRKRRPPGIHPAATKHGRPLQQGGEGVFGHPETPSRMPPKRLGRRGGRKGRGRGKGLGVRTPVLQRRSSRIKRQVVNCDQTDTTSHTAPPPGTGAESPMDALSGLLYEPTPELTPVNHSTTASNSEANSVQPTPNPVHATQASNSGRFQRSSEAMKRRIAISTSMSESVLKEITMSIRQQQSKIQKQDKACKTQL